MDIYNLVTGEKISSIKKFTIDPKALYFIHCNSADIDHLQNIFHFDLSTLIECMNFDESIRMDSFPGYDFISLIYFSLQEEQVLLSEINLYVGNNYIAMVTQEDDILVAEFILKLMNKILLNLYEPHQMNKVYYSIWNTLLTDFSETMEKMEDEINRIEKVITGVHDKTNFQLVTDMRINTYIIKKQLRPLLYIGDQMLVNENELILEENIRFFKNVDIRLNKLFDFSTSLQEYANQLLHIYESQMSTYTNDIINKLTIFTIFFGPLTVVTGIYGMNFTHMPELKWYYGYPMAMALMVLISLIIFIILKLKKWL